MDSMLLILVHGAFFVTHYSQSEAETRVLPKNPFIEENTSITFNCTTFVTWDIEGVRWQFMINDTDVYRVVIYKRGNECNHFGILPLWFSYSCVNNKGFTLTIENVTTNFHNLSVTCTVYNADGSSRSNSPVTLIRVAVSVKRAELLGPEYHAQPVVTTEYNNTVFTCTTTPSYPVANITWYHERGTQNDIDVITTNTTSSFVYGNDYLISLESNLTLRPSREFNGTHIYCTASNGFGERIFVSSEKLEVLVHYPPTKPMFDIRSVDVKGLIKVIKENSLSVYCRSNGYPTPSFSWIHRNKIIANNQLLTILNTTEMNNGNHTCRVANTLNWNHRRESENDISLTVLVPPTRPEFHFNNTSQKVVNDSLEVMTNDSFTVICNSYGIPTPVKRWCDLGAGDNILLTNHVQMDFSCICYATNEMTETIGVNKTVSKSATLSVNVLYPPKTPKVFIHYNEQSPTEVGENITIEEHESFKLSCFADSKPAVSNYTWTSQVIALSPSLNIRNVSKHQNGRFTCHASNLMKRSFGLVEMGSSSKTISMQILYAAQVSDFYIAGHRNNAIVITTQREPLTFLCNVDSNPGSTINVTFRGKTIVTKTDARTLTYFTDSISCDNAGVYYCSSANKYNYGKIKGKQLTLFVKCSPRPEKDSLTEKVTSLQYMPALLSFTAKDYLEPGRTTFQWQRETNVSKWKTLDNESNEIMISTSNLQTNLTVLNVTQVYSGKYRVVYNNSEGGNIQTFQLFVADLASNVQTPLDLTGVVTGSIVGSVAVIAGIMIGIYFYRKRHRRKEGTGTDSDNKSFDEVSEMKTIADRETSNRNVTAYEQIRPKTDRGVIERMEQTYEELGPDKGDVVDSSSPIYTNLALR